MTQVAAIAWTFRRECTAEVERLLLRYPPPDSLEITDDSGQVVGRMLATAVFMRDNLVVRVMEFEGPLPELLRQKSMESTHSDIDRALQQYLEKPADLTTPDGFRTFFADTAMRCLYFRKPASHATGATAR
jgi:hypothetical protein